MSLRTAPTRQRALRRSLEPAPLPAWPPIIAFLGTPVWWLLGVGDMSWIVLAAVMVVLMLRRGGIEVPRGTGVWLLFLAWMAFSIIGIDTGGRLIGFVYRAALYLALTVLFVYVYNARTTFTLRYAAGVLAGYWVIVVAGGFLGVFFPLLSITTPLAYVLPDSLLSNELVAEMAYRRVTQWDPTSFLALEPRPSAPFLYTNGWGNAYSLLLPVVIGYLFEVRGTRRFWVLLALVPVSFVPAFLTLNRGMFLGLGVAAIYIALRLVLLRNVKALAAITGVALVFGVVYSVLPAGERLTTRVETSSSTEDRANLYQETWERTLDAPLLGYGAPRPSFTPGAPSAGTQGHFWTVMFSHGLPGLALFVLFLLILWGKTWRSPGPVGIAANTAALVLVVEILYYGVLTSGLPIVFFLGAAALRATEALPARTGRTWREQASAAALERRARASEGMA